MNALIYETVAAYQTLLETEIGDVIQIEKALQKYETLLETQVDKAFDLFELYTLKNVFSVNGVESGKNTVFHLLC